MLKRVCTWAKDLTATSDCGHEQSKADDQPRHAVRGDVQHRDEEAEEQQRGTQVALQDEDRDADQPHDHDRAEVAGARQAHAEELAAADRQVVAVRHEISGEEDSQRDLHELAGLDRRSGPRRIQTRAPKVSWPRPGIIGEEQQEQGECAEGVGVAAQHAVVAQRDQDDGRDNDRDAHEEGLAEANHGLVPAGIGQVEAVDHRQPQARQRDGDRQDHGVRVGRQEVHADLGDDGDGDEDADLREQVRGDLTRVVQRGQHVAGDADGQGQAHEGQLEESARPGGRDRYGSH